MSIPKPGAMFYCDPFWIEVVDYSPKAKIIRFRRLTRDGKAPIERMGRKAFLKTARAG